MKSTEESSSDLGGSEKAPISRATFLKEFKKWQCIISGGFEDYHSGLKKINKSKLDSIKETFYKSRLIEPALPKNSNRGYSMHHDEGIEGKVHRNLKNYVESVKTLQVFKTLRVFDGRLARCGGLELQGALPLYPLPVWKNTNGEGKFFTSAEYYASMTEIIRADPNPCTRTRRDNWCPGRIDRGRWQAGQIHWQRRASRPCSAGDAIPQ
jgi:hypothetical protein